MRYFYGVQLLLLLTVSACAENLLLDQSEGQQPEHYATGDLQTMSVQTLFSELLVSSDKKYLETEQMLLAQGDEAVKFLRSNLAYEDPTAQLMVKGYTQWLEQGQNQTSQIDDAFAYLKTLPDKIKKTPVTSPPPMGVAANLEKNYGKIPATIFATHLMKVQDLPSWQVWSILLYLDSLKLPELNPALIRFANTTANEEWQSEAIKILQNTNDPDLKNKIAAEKHWLKNQNLTLHSSLSSL